MTMLRVVRLNQRADGNGDQMSRTVTRRVFERPESAVSLAVIVWLGTVQRVTEKLREPASALVNV